MVSIYFSKPNKSTDQNKRTKKKIGIPKNHKQIRRPLCAIMDIPISFRKRISFTKQNLDFETFDTSTLIRH